MTMMMIGNGGIMESISPRVDQRYCSSALAVADIPKKINVCREYVKININDLFNVCWEHVKIKKLQLLPSCRHYKYR